MYAFVEILSHHCHHHVWYGLAVLTCRTYTCLTTWTRDRTGPTATTNNLRWHLLTSHACTATPEYKQIRYKVDMPNQLQFFTLKKTRAWFRVEMLASFFQPVSSWYRRTFQRFHTEIYVSVCVCQEYMTWYTHVCSVSEAFNAILGSIACHVHWFCHDSRVGFTSLSNEIHALCPSIVLCR